MIELQQVVKILRLNLSRASPFLTSSTSDGLKNYYLIAAGGKILLKIFWGGERMVV